MIKPVITYTVICDQCGKNAMDSDSYLLQTTELNALLEAQEWGWVFYYHSHYCQQCWEHFNSEKVKCETKDCNNEG